MSDGPIDIDLTREGHPSFKELHDEMFPVAQIARESATIVRRTQIKVAIEAEEMRYSIV